MNKKISTVFIALILCTVSLSVVTIQGAIDETVVQAVPENVIFFTGGNGTVGNPYQISNVWELQNISLDLGANYSLVDDIDASITVGWDTGAGFDPIGNVTDVDNTSANDPFTGTLVGNASRSTGGQKSATTPGLFPRASMRYQPYCLRCTAFRPCRQNGGPVVPTERRW